MPRIYTLAEIDAMRKAIYAKNAPSQMIWSCRMDGHDGWTPETIAAMDAASAHTEDQLRTYMAAGIDPAEFDAKT